MPEAISIFISAGEASGEHYGALLTAALQRRMVQARRSARFLGMGGVRMAAAGLERVVRAEDVAVMGLTEVVRHLPQIYREFRKLKRAIRKSRPAVAVLIDSPEIHLRLAKEFHRLGIPVIYFVSPQLWAWKKHRIRLVQRYVRRMLVIFPFEEAWYRERGVEAEYVGHPLADLPIPKGPFGLLHARKPADPPRQPPRHIFALLPGSRRKEVQMNLPTMLQAAARIDAKDAFVVPVPETVPPRVVDRQLGGSRLWINTMHDARKALAMSRAAVVASGTATVEAALIGTPFAMPLPRIMMSGVTPAASEANIEPVRPKPVIISSAISSAPCR